MKSNFRRFAALSLASILTLQSVSPIFAYQAGTSGSSSSSGSVSSTPPSSPPSSSDIPVIGVIPDTSGDSSSGGGDTFIGGGCYCDCDKYEEYSVYTPKVTILHNVNALIAQNDRKSMYYIPTLDDLPFNLGDTALSIKEKNGTEHKFALVYDGMFDAESAYSTAKSTETTNNEKKKNYAVFHTSKDLVNDADTGSLAVNTIGTDILLTNEKFTVEKKDGTNVFDYIPSIAGTADLTGSQVVMDLYKALGVFEYRVQYSYSQDENWETNSSPILQELSFLTSKLGTDGFDISESRCDVSVSRTFPSYYWERFQKDGVNVGKQYTDTTSISNITHVDSALNKLTSVTLAQFINCAVALMNLYGEAAVSEAELEQFEKAYPMLMATSGELTELERNSLKYLVIKGIISEDELVNANWRAPVHLLTMGNNDGNSILEWLGRIASPESRLSMKEPAYVPAALAEAGYAGTTVELSDADATELVVQSIDSANTYDLLVEYTKPVSTDGVANNRSCYAAYNLSTDAYKEIYTVDKQTNKTTAGEEAIKNTKPGEDTNPDDDKIKELNDVPDDQKEEALQNIGLLLATGTVRLAGLKAAPSLNDLSNAETTNMYYYLGPEEFDGKLYYHFKISKTINKHTSIKIVVPTDSSSSVLYQGSTWDTLSMVTKDDKPVDYYTFTGEKLNISGGGVIPIEKTKPVTFDYEGFDRSYLDANAFAQYPFIPEPTLANEQYIYSFYVKSEAGMKKCFIDNGTSESSDKVVVNWKDMVVGDEDTYDFIVGQTNSLSVECKGDLKNVTVQCYIEEIKYDSKKSENETAKKDGYFIQILTNNKAAVESWEAISKKLKRKNSVYVDSENNEAYVKTTASGQVSTLVSCERLKNAGYITSYQELKEDVFVITVGSYENNIVINSKDKYIIVGNTIILPNGKDEMVFYTKDEDLGWLICLEACLGWAGSYSYIRDSANATIITNDTLYGYDATSQVNSLKTVTQCFPKSTIKTLWTDYQEISGFNMTSTYALAPFLIVMDMSNGSSNGRNDWLFVWHRQNTILTTGSKVKIPRAQNKFAREKFTELLTGEKNKDMFESVDSAVYCMTAYHLNTTNKQENVNKFPTEKDENYLPGFSYHQLKRKGIGKDETVTSGWVYNPPEYTKLSSALNAYAKAAKKGCLQSGTDDGLMSGQAAVDLAIPIFSLNGVYYDANVNFTGASEGDYLPVGTMAGKVVSTSAKGDVLKLDDKGFYQKDTSQTSADGLEVFTAPVAQFAALKGMGTASVSDLNTGAIYFGTSRCRLINGKVSFGDLNSSIPTDTTAIVSYLSTGNSTVYVISTGTSALSEILNTINTVLEYSLTDPDNLVNWTNYRMTRALAGADAWSSVALMFVIQILPRVVGLLFMLLMILSLIAPWAPWQKLCRNTFDVYKFLTLGHQTVDTIDLKRMFIVSLACSILMVMIYTGTLFEFMMFVAKFIIAFYQH